jgi:hypothetical protein
LTIGKEKVLVTDWSTEERARKIEEEKAEASGKDS